MLFLKLGTGKIDAEQVGGEDPILHGSHAIPSVNQTGARNGLDHPNPVTPRLRYSRTLSFVSAAVSSGEKISTQRYGGRVTMR